MTQARSVSQYKEYKDCPYRYYLHRVQKAPEKPAAWLPQGLGVHEAVEEYERSERTLSLDEAQDVFRESYAKHTNRLAEDTPNLNYWFASGPYRGATDIERRYKLGLEQVGRYLDYTERHPDETVWQSPDGPAIELSCSVDLSGVQVRGYIDQVVSSPTNGVVVRDVKSGNNPGDDFQLAVYAVFLLILYGAEVNTGDYWMGRTGKPTFPYKLTAWTVDTVTREFHWLDEQIRAENFDPKPEETKCRFCPVQAACSFSA